MKSLHSRIAIALVSVVIIIVATTAILVQREVSDQIVDSETKNAQYIADLTLMTISNEYNAYCFHRESLLRERRHTIKNNITIAFSHLERQYNRYKEGLISEKTAKEDIIYSLKKLRYDDGIGYFWINDCTQPIPKMVMHPTMPELDGTILDNPEFHCVIGSNENLFKVFLDVCLSKNEGYVDYLWPKPSPGGLTEQQPKLSFVKLFPEWNWVIGTGVYIDDIEKECQAHFNEIKSSMFNNLAKIKIAKSGYLFIVSGDDKMQLHPQLKGSDASSLYNPITNISMTDEIKNAVNNGIYVFDYIWSKPGEPEEEQYSKTAYIRYFEPLDWYIVISVYNDELLAPAVTLRTKILWGSFVFLAIAICLSWWLGRSISRPIASLANAARIIENEGINNTLLPVGGTIETQVLGTCLQSMVDTIRREHQELHMMSFLVESAASPIVMSDLEGKLIYVNPAFMKTWGYSNEKDILGCSTSDFWRSSDDIEKIKKLLQENEYIYEEVEAKGQEGTAFPVQIISAIVYDEEENSIAIMYSLLNITERKHAEEVIKEYNNALKADVQARTEELSNKNIQLENEIKERKKTELELKNTTSQLIQTEKMATIGQLAAGIAHEINTPLGAIGSSSDTLQKQFEELMDNLDLELELYQNNRLLIQTLIEKISQCDTILSSREFRKRKAYLLQELNKMGVENPDSAAALLTGIFPVDDHEKCLSIFKKEKSNEIIAFIQKIADIFKGIRIINTAVKQSSRVIFALKDYARAEEEQAMLETDIRDTIETAIILYGNKIKHGIDLKIEFEDVPHTLCHPHELCQIWTNLISNAIYAMENYGKLTIALKSDNNNNILIIFSDTGHGISKEIINNIFEPLFTTKPKGEGTGLGLDIVKRILNRHSGTITCNSEVDKGTTFTVTLPAITEK